MACIRQTSPVEHTLFNVAFSTLMNKLETTAICDAETTIGLR